MQFVDTHCHIHESTTPLRSDNPTAALWAKMATNDPDDLIAAAIKAGVSKMICVGTTVADSQLAADFVQSRTNCWASVGIHPHEAKSDMAKLDDLKYLVGQPKIAAIGECGLDYFYTHSPKQLQVQVLKQQIELALRHNLPLIFHVREAFDDFWPIFDSYKGIKGVLHSFTDTHQNLEKALTRDLYIGVNGIATFTKDPKQTEMFKAIPLQKLLLETDAPFLTPVPNRGKVNEPAFVTLVANFLANLRSIRLEELSAATSQNATQLFLLK